MRYLLDELGAYEEGYSDIMMPDRASARHETFMGRQEGSSSSVTHRDLQIFGERLIQQVQHIVINPHTVHHPGQGKSSPSLERTT
jgi:hypothetical protein